MKMMYIREIFNNDKNSANLCIVKLLISIKLPYLLEGTERPGKFSINTFLGRYFSRLLPKYKRLKRERGGTR
jgi:hypothetical protein